MLDLPLVSGMALFNDIYAVFRYIIYNFDHATITSGGSINKCIKLILNPRI